MHPSAWFGVAVRVVGVWMVVQSASSFIYAFNLAKGLDSLRSMTPMAMVNQGVGYLAMGLFLIKLAPLVVSWAYPRRADMQVIDEEATKGDEG